MFGSLGDYAGLDDMAYPVEEIAEEELSGDDEHYGKITTRELPQNWSIKPTPAAATSGSGSAADAGGAKQPIIAEKVATVLTKVADQLLPTSGDKAKNAPVTSPVAAPVVAPELAGPPAQPKFPWLWIFGGLVVAGGIGYAATRKK